MCDWWMIVCVLPICPLGLWPARFGPTGRACGQRKYRGQATWRRAGGFRGHVIWPPDRVCTTNLLPTNTPRPSQISTRSHHFGTSHLPTELDWVFCCHRGGRATGRVFSSFCDHCAAFWESLIVKISHPPPQMGSSHPKGGAPSSGPGGPAQKSGPGHQSAPHSGPDHNKPGPNVHSGPGGGGPGHNQGGPGGPGGGGPGGGPGHHPR